MRITVYPRPRRGWGSWQNPRNGHDIRPLIAHRLAPLLPSLMGCEQGLIITFLHNSTLLAVHHTLPCT